MLLRIVEESMIEKETLKELGKMSLTVSVAWLVFGIIQPVFSGKFSIVNGAIASFSFLAFLSVGVILLNRGAKQ